jgi:excinuclease ABC subunit C
MSRRRRARSTSTDIEARVVRLRDQVRAEAHDRPGVYWMESTTGEIVYVGKSKQLRTRLLGYFRAEFPADKSARIIREAEALHWEYLPSEFASLLEELRLIKQWRPRYNVMMKRDARHYAFVRIAPGPAPRFQVVRGAGGSDHGTYYGPFQGARQLEEALRELNDALSLRDCRLDQPMHFADQPELPVAPPRTPGCIRFEIGRCLGPCVAATTQREYNERFALAREFLEGQHDAPITALRGTMEALSDALAFERAAHLRDKIARLESLREQFARIRFAVERLSFVYEVPGRDEQDRVYIIRRGRVRDTLDVPRTAAERAALDARVAEIFAPPERTGATVPAHEIDELLLIASWFRKFPHEHARTRVPPSPVVAA